MNELKNGVTKPIQMEKLGNTTKKLSLKGFAGFKTPDDQFKTSWAKLKESVDAVFQSQSIAYTLEELYRDVENTCTIKMGPQLYKHLHILFAKYVNEMLPVFVREETSNSRYLKTVSNSWEIFCRRILMIRSIFLFMDRQLAVHNSDILSLWDLSLSLFRDNVVKDNRVRNRLLESVMHEIKLERDGETVDRQLLRSIVRMYSDLQMYKEDLETYFLRSTNLAYQKESQIKISELDVGAYLQHVLTRLKEEEDRVGTYLEASSRHEVIETLVSQLVSGNINRLLKQGLVPMIKTQRLDQLQKMYTVLNMVPIGLEELRKAFAEHIKNDGWQIVDNPNIDPEKDKQLIQRLLDLKDELHNIVSECFEDDPNFFRAMNEAFEEFINQRPNKPAEYLAKYLDSKLRSGNKSQTEEELDKLMDKAMILFRFIHGKDVFDAFYTKELAKRLLMGKSASVDAEKSMLSKLKQECGPNYTKKMETMFQDIELSRQLSKAFKEHGNNLGIDLTVNVICPASWPTYPQSKAIYPQEMIDLAAEFTRFYKTKHQGRKLIFEPSLGSCTLKAYFPVTGNRSKELYVSEFQALVLVQFNDTDSLSYQIIEAATAIEESELRKTLLSLSKAKGQRVLNKASNSTEIDSDETFSFNDQFSHKLTRIKFNKIQLKETPEEQEATEERVFTDRIYHVDCCIVRIMKMRKTIDHNALMSEAYNQLKFPLKASDVKKRIESLIERDYMKRDANNSATYHYIA